MEEDLEDVPTEELVRRLGRLSLELQRRVAEDSDSEGGEPTPAPTAPGQRGQPQDPRPRRGQRVREEQRNQAEPEVDEAGAQDVDPEDPEERWGFRKQQRVRTITGPAQIRAQRGNIIEFTNVYIRIGLDNGHVILREPQSVRRVLTS